MEGGKWIDGISEVDREIAVPSFKNPTEIRTGLKKYPPFSLTDPFIVINTWFNLWFIGMRR
jgi:hypothetical protein